MGKTRIQMVQEITLMPDFAIYLNGDRNKVKFLRDMIDYNMAVRMAQTYADSKRCKAFVLKTTNRKLYSYIRINGKWVKG